MHFRHSCHILVLICLTALAINPVYALTPVAAVDPRVGQLEEKLFMHAYRGDSAEARIERLEVMVFGQKMPGSEFERLDRLLVAVHPSEIVSGKKADSTPAASEPAAPPPVSTNQPEAIDALDSDTAADGMPAATREPQKAIPPAPPPPVRRPYRPAEKANRRDDRMPLTAPDAVFSGDRRQPESVRSAGNVRESMPPVAPDFSVGSNRAIQIAPPHMVRQPAGSRQPAVSRGLPAAGRSGQEEIALRPPIDPYNADDSGGQAESPEPQSAAPLRPAIGRPAPQTDSGSGSAAAQAAPGLRQRIGVLELQVFGSTFAQQPLPDRLAHLESAVYPGSQPLADLPVTKRVERLLNDPGVRSRADRTNPGLLPSQMSYR